MPENLPAPEDDKELALKEYASKMDVYHDLTNRMRQLEKRYPAERREEATNFEIQDIDKNRHDLHLEMLNIAKNLGKDKNDVLIDIVRWDNSLEEYGLPEFSILKSADVIDTGGFHSATQFNIDSTGKPEKPTPLDRNFTDYPGGPAFSDDKVLIVFAVTAVVNYGDVEVRPNHYEERVERAHALAEYNIQGGEYFHGQMGGSHETSAYIEGVLIPKNKLEEVCSVIRNNPEKFRLGEEFYKK